jgi:hypothetical protein
MPDPQILDILYCRFNPSLRASEGFFVFDLLGVPPTPLRCAAVGLCAVHGTLLQSLTQRANHFDFALYLKVINVYKNICSRCARRPTMLSIPILVSKRAVSA